MHGKSRRGGKPSTFDSGSPWTISRSHGTVALGSHMNHEVIAPDQRLSFYYCLALHMDSYLSRKAARPEQHSHWTVDNLRLPSTLDNHLLWKPLGLRPSFAFGRHDSPRTTARILTLNSHTPVSSQCCRQPLGVGGDLPITRLGWLFTMGSHLLWTAIATANICHSHSPGLKLSLILERN